MSEPEKNDQSRNAKGGTELMAHALYRKVAANLLEPFQIIQSRVREIKQEKIPIYWLHDLPGDPESDHLHNGGYARFERLVFVSNWQMQAYNQHYGVPYSKSVVLQNAIDPITPLEKPEDEIRFIYHTTPHRGLSLLVPVFAELAKQFDNIVLDVFSSFKLYGWPERDREFEPLFAFCRQHPRINYHGAVSNEEVRRALAHAHVFAYPSIWMETSCISLMEAMSAGCICVHPNYGALPETSANLTTMYQWHEDQREHSAVLYSLIRHVLGIIRSEQIRRKIAYAKQYADTYYSWDLRASQWSRFLTGILERRKISEI